MFWVLWKWNISYDRYLQNTSKSSRNHYNFFLSWLLDIKIRLLQLGGEDRRYRSVAYVYVLFQFHPHIRFLDSLGGGGGCGGAWILY